MCHIQCSTDPQKSANFIEDISEHIVLLVHIKPAMFGDPSNQLYGAVRVKEGGGAGRGGGERGVLVKGRGGEEGGKEVKTHRYGAFAIYVMSTHLYHGLDDVGW